jgi:nucleotide-binding universal stress UspA family protein
MPEELRPVVAAYDGSPAAQAAMRAAGELFRGRTVDVVSVWEPGLAMLASTTQDPSGLAYLPPRPEDVAVLDQIGHDHAAELADAGAALVREAGGIARARPVRDGVDVADTLATIAEEVDAAAIVLGSRGLRGLRSAMLGSTSRKLLHDVQRPVLIVRTPPD